MPCSSELPGERAMEDAAEIDKLTRMLCELCHAVETANKGRIRQIALSTELSAWWDEHKKWDRRRRKEEKRERMQRRLRQEGISKLTKEERRALGIRREN